MNKLVYILLALIGVAGAQEGCTEEDVMECFAQFVKLADNDMSDEEVCEHVGDAYSCVRNKAEECLSDEDLAEIESDLEPMRNVLQLACSSDDDDESNEIETEFEESTECMSENEEYILGCVDDMNPADVIVKGVEKGLTEEKEFACLGMQVVAQCMTDRAMQTCGPDSGRIFEVALEEAMEEEDC